MDAALIIVHPVVWALKRAPVRPSSRHRIRSSPKVGIIDHAAGLLGNEQRRGNGGGRTGIGEFQVNGLNCLSVVPVMRVVDVDFQFTGGKVMFMGLVASTVMQLLVRP